MLGRWGTLIKQKVAGIDIPKAPYNFAVQVGDPVLRQKAEEVKPEVGLKFDTLAGHSHRRCPFIHYCKRFVIQFINSSTLTIPGNEKRILWWLSTQLCSFVVRRWMWLKLNPEYFAFI